MGTKNNLRNICIERERAREKKITNFTYELNELSERQK
jgi:hypothetical protein